MKREDLHHAARLLSGEVCGGQILCPGPQHSAKDRSLAVRFSGDNFIVHSFCGDDPIRCRDHVRERLGLAAWQPSQRTSRTRRYGVKKNISEIDGEPRPMTEKNSSA